MTKAIEKLELAILSDVFRYRHVVDLKLPVKRRQTLISALKKRFLVKRLVSTDNCFIKALNHICYRFPGITESLEVLGGHEKKLLNHLPLGSISNRKVLKFHLE